MITLYNIIFIVNCNSRFLKLMTSNGNVYAALTAGKLFTGATTPTPWRVVSGFSQVQSSRLKLSLPLPSVLRNHFILVDGPPSSSVGNPDEIRKRFPNLFGQSSVMLLPGGGSNEDNKSLRIGVVLSGGQAPGGHNVISGIFDYLQERAKGSKMYGFKGGPAGIMKFKYVELTSDVINPYRNQGGFDMICSGRDKIETPEQLKQAADTVQKLDLDGLVVIGGDDSNTNACILAEYFRGQNLKTRVIGCPKTIDGDLKCKEVPISFGFDTATKIFAELIGNVMVDARSTGKYYHFVRLMGRAASHITLECALQTHPNIAIIGEEVAAQKLTLKNVTGYITDIICKRAELGYNYGVILIPEGLIDFIPEAQQLISELNEILAHDAVDKEGVWKKKLRSQSCELFEFLPQDIQDQLLLERDPHGNVQVSKIETEKMLIQMIRTELEKRRKEGLYNKTFIGQHHFFGYEGRCGLPSNFDSNYCYALGYGAAALLQSGKTGLISSVANLGAPVEKWTVGGTCLLSLSVSDAVKQAEDTMDTLPHEEINLCIDITVYQRSYDICMQLYEKDVLTDSTILHIYGIQSADLNSQQLAVAAVATSDSHICSVVANLLQKFGTAAAFSLGVFDYALEESHMSCICRGLSEWRDVVARAEDESTGFILPNKILLEIAKQMPTTTSMLRRAVKSRHHYIDRNLGSVVSIIRNSMQNAAAYETIAEKLKEDRKKAISDGKLVVADGSEALSHLAVPDTTDSVQHENILELATNTSEVERNEHEGSSDHSRKNLNSQNDKDGCVPAHPRNNLTMSRQIREGSGTEATVQVLKKPNRGFGALLGNSASKRKYDSEKVESKEAKLEQIKSSVNLPFHAFSGEVETLQPVTEPAKSPQSLCHKEPVALSAADSEMQDILVIDDDSDEEMFNDDKKSADDKLEQTEGNTPANMPSNSESDEELLEDDPKFMDNKLEQTDGNAVLSNKSPVLDIIMLDDDSDEETVKVNPESASDESPQDIVSTCLPSNEKDETMSLSDLPSAHLQTAGKTKLVKNSEEQGPSGLLQIKPFDYEAARKEVRFGEDRKRNDGNEGGKNKRDTGNRKKNAGKGQLEGSEESGGFQLGRRRQAFPVTGNRSATFR